MIGLLAMLSTRDPVSRLTLDKDLLSLIMPAGHIEVGVGSGYGVAREHYSQSEGLWDRRTKRGRGVKGHYAGQKTGET